MHSILLARSAGRLSRSQSVIRCLSTPPGSAKPPPPPPPPPLNTSPAPPTKPLLETTGPHSLTLDFSPESNSEHTAQRTGAKSSKDSLSSSERRRRFLGRVALGLFVSGLGAQAVYLGREWGEDELKAKNLRLEDAPSTFWRRSKSRLGDMFDYFNKPVWPELLPPPLPPPHQKPLTLVLEIDDLLVTSTWDRHHGWRTAKRPGVDYFLAYLSQFYELVVFTTQPHYTAIPILERLDPYNFYINYKLFREATRSHNGKIVKDLSYLNRDLSKVVVLDTREDHVSTHPENAIILPKWNGDPKDRGLIAMIPFLESIGIYRPPDVRPILQAYAGKVIPVEYAKAEAEAKQKHIEEWNATKGIAGGGLSISRLFGGRSGEEPGATPLTYLEQKRKEAQRQYKEEQAYIELHKGDFERLMEEDRQAMAKEMSGTLWGALDSLAGGGPKKEKETKPTAQPDASGASGQTATKQ